MKTLSYRQFKFELIVMKTVLFWILIAFGSCQKFLDKKMRNSEFVPSTIDQLQTLLENAQTINSADPYLLEVLADNLYVKTTDWNSRSSTSAAQNYIWASNALPDQPSWTLPYSGPIYNSNVVLDQLPKITINDGEQDIFNSLRGSCLFYRAFAFYSLAQIYCKPYSSSNADSMGIILRLSSNYNEKGKRATVQQTYDQILNDLLIASDLLPLNSAFPTRPTKAAAYAMLSRVYLSMGKYVDAGKYADQALQLKNNLIDFNTLIPIGSPPIKTFNPEVIYQSCSLSNSFLSASIVKIDSTLYNSYDDNDLRKTIFFKPNTGANIGTYGFRGSYHGNLGVDIMFTGLTTGELYLIRAESFARQGKVNEALADLNILLQKRWKNSVAFTNVTAVDAADALNKILTERRKELVYRGQRWTDIRRLNLEGANITLKRVIGTTTYILPPNDLRIAILIPTDEISKSGITQNPR